MKKLKIITSAMAALVLYGVTAQAQTYNYQSGDLLAAFRSTSGSKDVIVDLGSAASFQSGSSLSLNLNPVLSDAFGTTSGLYWSVFGYVNTTGSALGAKNTLFVTDPRSDISTANDPNSSLTSSGQGQVVSKMTAIANGATFGTSVIFANQMVEVDKSLNVGGNPVSYTVGVGSLGDFNGTWAPDVENLSTGGNTTSDLFEQDPGAANNGIYLGSVTLNGGTLSFSPVPEPSTWMMIGSGALALLALRRRK
ncbi:MAG TPA: PEP-CTERM sorting domain-containing protein [Verrucomicrobiae bacterium]|nr:PEP-CTERM sorting domain-containing protein [Verrucomicrobiae bacterium]